MSPRIKGNPMVTDREIVYKFAMWRNIRGWSLKKLSIHMNVDKGHLSKVLSQKEKPSKKVIKEMCYLLNRFPVDFNTAQRR